MLVVGFGLGFGTEKSLKNGSNEIEDRALSISNDAPPASSGEDISPMPDIGENYFQKFSLGGKIISMTQSELQISISNIDAAEALNLKPSDSGKRKILITDQTKIVAEPENTTGDPASSNINTSPETSRNEYKTITLKDLVKDDIIFIMTVEDIQTTNELTAIKIVKEQSDLMEAAPLPES